MTKLTFSVIGKCILLTALSCILQSCSAQYSAESITGWVVDADTGRPLEGVNVTANWRVEEGNVAGTNDGGDIQIMEAVTDQSGRYQFPAWGPKPLPPKKNGLWVDQYIGNGDPELVFFKSGYKLDSRSNVLVVSEHNRSLIRRSDWNGKTIELKPLGASTEENIDNLTRAGLALSFALHADGCEWQKIPRMLAAQLKEAGKFTKQNTFSLLSISNIPTDSQCALPQEFLKEYLK